MFMSYHIIARTYTLMGKSPKEGFVKVESFLLMIFLTASAGTDLIAEIQCAHQDQHWVDLLVCNWTTWRYFAATMVIADTAMDLYVHYIDTKLAVDTDE